MKGHGSSPGCMIGSAGLWRKRLEVRSARIRNYEPQPSHWMNRRFEDVWMGEK